MKLALSLFLATFFVCPAAILHAADDDTDFFQKKVEPLLKAKCLECHSHAADTMEGGLTLDSRSGWHAGGDSGPEEKGTFYFYDVLVDSDHEVRGR